MFILTSQNSDLLSLSSNFVFFTLFFLHLRNNFSRSESLFLVCALPPKEMEKEACAIKKEEESVTKIFPPSTLKRKGQGKITDTPLNREFTRLLERRRRCGGGGVKIREPEEQKEEKEKQKSDDDVEIVAEVNAGDAREKPRNVIDISSDEELSSDEKVAKINEVLLSYLEQLPPEATDSEFGY